MSYKPGNWWLVCDVCGKNIYATEAKHRWDGLIVCKEDYEQRHPMDFLKIKPDNFKVPFTRPEPEDQFSSVSYIDTGDAPYCTIFTASAAADYATADCAKADAPLPGL